MLRRTFLGILAAIPFWRKAKEPNVTWKRCGRIPEPSKLEYRITPLTGPRVHYGGYDSGPAADPGKNASIPPSGRYASTDYLSMS